MWKYLMVLLTCVFLTGCSVGNISGVSTSMGSFERGLWFDHDIREYQPHGFGVKFDIVAGHMIRPVPKFWKKDQNVWKGSAPWFVVRVPLIGPYVGIACGEMGVYGGLKTFQVQERHRVPERYGKWMRDKEFPADPNGTMTYIQLSATMRRTRWK